MRNEDEFEMNSVAKNKFSWLEKSFEFVLRQNKLIWKMLWNWKGKCFGSSFGCVSAIKVVSLNVAMNRY